MKKKKDPQNRNNGDFQPTLMFFHQHKEIKKNQQKFIYNECISLNSDFDIY